MRSGSQQAEDRGGAATYLGTFLPLLGEGGGQCMLGWSGGCANRGYSRPQVTSVQAAALAPGTVSSQGVKAKSCIPWCNH